MNRTKSDARLGVEGSPKSPHAFMREALGAKARLVGARRALLAQSLAAEEEALASQRGYRAADVDAYFEVLAAEQSPPLPRLRSWRK